MEKENLKTNGTKERKEITKRKDSNDENKKFRK